MKLFLFACLCPSLSLAWCSSGGGLGNIVGGTSKQYRSSLPHTTHNLHHGPFAKRQQQHCLDQPTRSNALKLWSINGGNQDDEPTTKTTAASATKSTSQDINVSTDKMTLKKASKLLSTFWSMAYPYYQESQPGRRLFYGMILLTLMNSGVSVAFSYISKDFWNALSSKDTAEFYSMMVKFGGALVVGAPVAVLYR